MMESMQAQMRHHRVIVVLMGLGVLMVALLGLEAMTMVVSSDPPSDEYPALLRTLEQRDATLTLYFKQPIAGDLLQVTLPQQDGEGEMLRELTEIGADYLCYRDATEAEVMIYCVAFENIASLAYPE